MSSMLERVARAICAARHDDFNGWDTLDAAEREQFMKEASAVLEAMKTPTEAMTEAGLSPTWQWVDEGSDDVWKRMIDAALKEI